MPNSNFPRGFMPIRETGGSPYSGGMTWYKMLASYATAVFTGDVVKLLTTGYINLAAAGDQMRGVAAGFRYVDAFGQPKFSAYWPGSGALSGSEVDIAVIDDPNVLFIGRFTNSASNPVRADVGANFNLFAGAGTPATGQSTMGVDYTTLTTSAAQWRFLEFLQRPDNDILAASSAYCLGVFAPALHDFRVNTGI